jgi:D-aminoacyl-tRNA deacylase
MRAVVQRVSEARVKAGDETVGEISAGFVVLLGVCDEDTEADIKYLADKIVNLRVFEDDEEKLNLSLLDTNGEMLVVSQFTLLGDCRKGRRPSFSHAAPPEKADEYYQKFCDAIKSNGIKVETGRFRAMMDVELTNHGPVTLLIDSKKDF